MAATLSIRDYLDHFLFNRDKELTHGGRIRLDSCNGQQPSMPPACYNADARLPSPTKSNNNLAQLQNHGIMLAHVHEYSRGGEENLIYSKRIEGNKSADVYGIFVQEMIGTRSLKASQIHDGRMSRGSSISDVSSVSAMDIDEGYLQPCTTVSIELLSSRSPSNIGSSEILTFIEHCKRNRIKWTMSIRFAHAYTWDNKYNREGIECMHARGVRLSSVGMYEILQCLLDDVREDLESLGQLQTCRGVIAMDNSLINKAMSILRQSITIRSDQYHLDQEEKLGDICQTLKNSPHNKYSPSTELAIFPLETYRECILLQNSEKEWGKVKVTVRKLLNGAGKSHDVYGKVLSRSDKVSSKSIRNSKPKDLDYGRIWAEVGAHVTMADLSRYDEIVIRVDAIISEYTGRTGWVEELTHLHEYLRDRTEDGEIYKVRVETVVRYAHSAEGPIPMSTLSNGAKSNGSGISTFGFPKGMTVECLHVRDIFSEMLQDLENSFRHLGSLEYDRGSNLRADECGILRSITSIRTAIMIVTNNGDFAIQDNFVDEYAEELNGF